MPIKSKSSKYWLVLAIGCIVFIFFIFYHYTPTLLTSQTERSDLCKDSYWEGVALSVPGQSSTVTIRGRYSEGVGCLMGGQIGQLLVHVPGNITTSDFKSIVSQEGITEWIIAPFSIYDDRGLCTVPGIDCAGYVGLFSRRGNKLMTHEDSLLIERGLPSISSVSKNSDGSVTLVYFQSHKVDHTYQSITFAKQGQKLVEVSRRDLYITP